MAVAYKIYETSARVLVISGKLYSWERNLFAVGKHCCMAAKLLLYFSLPHFSPFFFVLEYSFQANPLLDISSFGGVHTFSFVAQGNKKTWSFLLSSFLKIFFKK